MPENSIPGIKPPPAPELPKAILSALYDNRPLTREIDGTQLTTEYDEDTYEETRPQFFSAHDCWRFIQNPKLWHHQHTVGEKPDKEALRLGRATHALIFKGKQFPIAEPPVNPKTDKAYGSTSKIYSEWRADQPRDFVSSEEAELIIRLNNAVATNDLVNSQFRGQHGNTEVMVLPPPVSDKLHLRGRIDYLSEDMRVVVDLKTCDDLDQFERHMVQYGYFYLIAFYACLLPEQPNVVFVAVEKQEPHRVGVFMVEPTDLAHHMEGCRKAMARLEKWDLSDRFDNVVVVAKPSWARV